MSPGYQYRGDQPDVEPVDLREHKFNAVEDLRERKREYIRWMLRNGRIQRSDVAALLSMRDILDEEEFQ